MDQKASQIAGKQNIKANAEVSAEPKFFRLKEGMTFDVLEQIPFPSDRFDEIPQEAFEQEFLEGSLKVVCLGVPSDQFKTLVSRREQKLSFAKA